MILWVVIRRLLALIIRLLMINRIVSAGVFVLLFAGLIGYPLVTGATTTAPTTSAVGPAVAAAPVNRAASAGAPAPSRAVEDYLKGMETFDAKLMWNALSPQAISQMQSQGGSVDKLQQGLDQAKQAGAQYEEVSYIGSYPLRDGTTYYFFVVTRRGFTQSAPNGVDQVYFVFTVGPDGKILRIE